eukprot:TRINITY_DN4003_c0_g2_i1.p1 TRINITY_DN4003_c0_g2~~TRINITY_DN4003_c0_g2_i1.p1  ORF type:complete len:472 (+),score=86.04 TRINITY_DN4003_c0_g2_i1:92-1507(+)
MRDIWPIVTLYYNIGYKSGNYSDVSFENTYLSTICYKNINSLDKKISKSFDEMNPKSCLDIYFGVLCGKNITYSNEIIYTKIICLFKKFESSDIHFYWLEFKLLLDYLRNHSQVGVHDFVCIMFYSLHMHTVHCVVKYSMLIHKLGISEDVLKSARYLLNKSIEMEYINNPIDVTITELIMKVIPSGNITESDTSQRFLDNFLQIIIHTVEASNTTNGFLKDIINHLKIIQEQYINANDISLIVPHTALRIEILFNSLQKKECQLLKKEFIEQTMKFLNQSNLYSECRNLWVSCLHILGFLTKNDHMGALDHQINMDIAEASRRIHHVLSIDETSGDKENIPDLTSETIERTPSKYIYIKKKKSNHKKRAAVSSPPYHPTRTHRNSRMQSNGRPGPPTRNRIRPPPVKNISGRSPPIRNNGTSRGYRSGSPPQRPPTKPPVRRSNRNDSNLGKHPRQPDDLESQNRKRRKM